MLQKLNSRRGSVLNRATTISMAFGASMALLTSMAAPQYAAAAETVTRGGKIVEAAWLALSTLDPHLSNAGDTNYSLFFDSMFNIKYTSIENGEYEIVPGLATSYEVKDPTTVVMKLRDGVVFHDGSKWNAELAKWNLERARDHKDSGRKTTVKEITEITVVDPLTIQLTLNSPQPLLQMMLSPANPLNVYIVSKAAVEAKGEVEFGRSPVGSGPFQVAKWTPDDRIELKKFPNHWEMGVDGKPLPYVDEYVVRLITDTSVSTLELRAGNVNFAQRILDQDVESLKRDPNVKLFEAPRFVGAPSFYISSKADSKSPFSKDVRLRQAVQHAINREAMAAALGFGTGKAHYYWGFYPGSPGFDESLPRYEYNLDRAKKLLAEAGHPNGIELNVKVINRPTDVQPLEVMQGMLSQVGIKLNIELLDRTPWVDDGRKGNFEALAHRNASLLDPMLRFETRTGSSSNWASYSNPKVDALWEKAGAEYDIGKRGEIYKDMQRVLYDDAYHFIGFRTPLVQGVSKDLMGMEHSAGYDSRYLWLKK